MNYDDVGDESHIIRWANWPKSNPKPEFSGHFLGEFPLGNHYLSWMMIIIIVDINIIIQYHYYYDDEDEDNNDDTHDDDTHSWAWSYSW